MRRIGLVGGMSWESSALYYQLVNEHVRDRLGGFHSALCTMASVDFHDVEALQAADDWDRAGELLAREAAALEAGGAECLVLCTNTMHLVADRITDAVSIPLLHIVDVAADAIAAAGVTTVALLATGYTMSSPLYPDRLADRGIETIVPDAADRETVHAIIYDELVQGVVRDASRAAYVEVIDRLVERGAQGVILGCTEIELLVGQGDVDVPVFPTTALHAVAAVDFALARG
ncbi:aspartate racemase [Mumia flava]|uniref:Aspartate racemase n=1 Tax=Mumia flava TaxID=1348852 RepID=A0A0B2B3X2_9ACTN|nr:aspartate/glutamate racemase family protein [Mumia flava]PJJ53446.1 aspartate racemase [Mumia flava]